jgi:hypothetical protein
MPVLYGSREESGRGMEEKIGRGDRPVAPTDHLEDRD